MATDSFGKQTGSHEVTGRDTQLLQLSCHSQRLQQAVHTSDTHPWLLLSWHGKFLTHILLFFLPSPIQLPPRISYTVLFKLKMWVSPRRIRLHGSRNDLRAPESPPVPASSGGWSHRLILRELLGSSATAQETCPRSMAFPFSGHNLSLILLGMAETHKMNIRKTDECVHTEKCNSLSSIRCKSCCTKWSFPAFPQWLSDRKELSENKCSYQITGIDFLS